MIKNYRKFVNEEFNKEEFEKKSFQRAGDATIISFIKKNDYDGIRYLVDNGYHIKNKKKLLLPALKSLNFDMLDFLSDKLNINIANCGVTVNDISWHSIANIKKKLEIAKIIIQNGGKFASRAIYIPDEMKCFYKKSKSDKAERFMKFCDWTHEFIDWLLDNYPENYIVCRKYLPDHLKSKYGYLVAADDHDLI